MDGALKNCILMRCLTPHEVGLERQIVIGKHSGTAALINKFKEYGRVLTEEEANLLLPHVRKMAIQLKRPLFDKELMYLYEDVIGKGKAKAI